MNKRTVKVPLHSAGGMWIENNAALVFHPKKKIQIILLGKSYVDSVQKVDWRSTLPCETKNTKR